MMAKHSWGKIKYGKMACSNCKTIKDNRYFNPIYYTENFGNYDKAPDCPPNKFEYQNKTEVQS